MGDTELVTQLSMETWDTVPFQPATHSKHKESVQI